MPKTVTVSERVYARLLALRGERTRGRCKTLSDVIDEYIPDCDDDDDGTVYGDDAVEQLGRLIRDDCDDDDGDPGNDWDDE